MPVTTAETSGWLIVMVASLPASSIHPTQNQDCVVATEPEAGAHRDRPVDPARLVANQVDASAIRVWTGAVAGHRRQPGTKDLHANRRFQRAARAHQVPGHRLGRGHRYPVAEDFGQNPR